MTAEKMQDVDNNRPTKDERRKRDLGLDQTLEDSYPASDPPSTIPDPEEDSEAA
jgi:hypothetical protein